MRPRAYRDRGLGEEIRLALAPCTLGWVLAAVTDKGLCAVEIGDDPEAMIADFTDNFRNAHKVEGRPSRSNAWSNWWSPPSITPARR